MLINQKIEHTQELRKRNEYEKCYHKSTILIFNASNVWMKIIVREHFRHLLYEFSI